MKVKDEETLWRVFCAVELPEQVRAMAAAHITQLREGAPHVRAGWERAEKMHITLKFLGEIEPERVAALERAAVRATAHVVPFSIAVEGAGAFHTRGIPRVLWLGVRDEADGLKELQRCLEDECAREGFPRESKPFHPHLTIARLRVPEGTRELASLHRQTGFISEAFPVTQLIIIRSELAPEGSHYTPLSAHPLGEQQTAADVQT